MIMGRSILNEQVSSFNKRFHMYGHAALSIANSLSDLPFFVCNITVYLMTGAFWTFRLISCINYLSMQGSPYLRALLPEPQYRLPPPWHLRSRHSERFVEKDLPRCHQLVLLDFSQITVNEYFQVSRSAVTVLFPSERLIKGVFLRTIVR